MTSWLLLNFPTWLLAALVIGIPTLGIMAATVVVRRRVRWELLAEHNSLGVDIWARLGTLYAILLGFVVVIAWQQLGEVKQILANEASTIVTLHREAGGFVEPHRGRVRQALEAYTRSIIDEEWSTMEIGQSSVRTESHLDALWLTFGEYEPLTARETTAYEGAHGRLPDLTRQRSLRLLSSGAAIPGVLWVLLVAGAAMNIAFALLMGMRSLRTQVAMNGMLTAMLSATLFLIVMLDRPFTGDVRAEPTVFEEALRLMEPSPR